MQATARAAGVGPQADIAARIAGRNPHAIVDPQQTVEVVTDQDGRAAATVVLGTEIGPEVAEVKASVVGHPEARTTTLVASAVSGTGNPADTSLVGTVLSTEHKPIPGVTLVIDGTTIGAVSGADGRFAIVGAPAGHRHLVVNGTTANHGAVRYPSIGFEVDLLLGATISMPRPIYLPTMDRSNEVLAGGDEEVTLQLPGMPGVEVVIAPHSTIRADGVRGPVWMWTSPVNAQAIPMPPPGGIVPTLAATLQPSGTRLDPPARIRWPNMQGMPPGHQAFMLSFDHDLGAFVSQGTITVSDDGAYMTSDPGSGLSKAGWYFACDTPIPTGDSEGECPQELSISGPSEVLIGLSFAVRAVNGGPLPLSLPLRWSAPPQPGTLPDGTRVTFSLRVDRAEGDHADVTIIADREVPMGTKSTLTISAMPAKLSAKASLVVTPLKVTASMVRFIAVDGNRDGVLTFAEEDAVSAAHPWRWWVNDDADQPGAEIDSAADTPGSGTNATSLQVNGLRDLVDWFPLGIDVPALVNYFPPAQGYTYRLAVGPLAVVPTTLAAVSAFDYLTKAHSTGFGYLLTQVPEDAQVQSVDGATGTVAVPKIMALNATGQVFLAEGRRSGADAVELQVWDAQKKTVIQQKLPLSVSSVKNMYRWINLRHAVGKTDEQRATNAASEPANYPDSMANGKMVVWIHGFNVPEVGGEAWGAEMFKRLYQAGSKAMFTAVHWAGDEKKGLGLPPSGLFVADYHLAVQRAFASAQAYADAVASLPGTAKLLVSHSLGVGVVGSAIADHGFQGYSKFIALNAAMAQEAFAADLAVVPEMIPTNWRDDEAPAEQRFYPERLWSANWYKLFPKSDSRHALSWRGRLSGIRDFYNFYSPGEEVLQPSTGAAPSISNAAAARGAWQLQEWAKGQPALYGLTNGSFGHRDHGGWGFNSTYAPVMGVAMTVEDANQDPDQMQIPANADPQYYERLRTILLDLRDDERLKKQPFFPPFDVQNELAKLVLGQGSALLERQRLLAQAIPAVTQPLGSSSLEGLNGNYDMQAGRNGWLSKKKYPEHQNWFHSDIKDVAYLYVHPVIRHLIDISSIGAP